MRTCPGESACRPTETNERRSRFGASGIRTSFLLRLVGLAVSLGLALAVAMDDIDFFSAADFADTTAPHHEHIFVALLLVAVAFALWPRRGWW